MNNLAFSTDYEKIRRNIVRIAASYLELNPELKSLVVGVSGGVDSALICALAREVCDARLKNVELIGYSMPITSNKEDEITRARDIGSLFCDKFTTVDWLARPYRAFVGDAINEEDLSFEEKIRHGNIKARVRMIFLFDQAHRHHGMVLSTDNLTELLLGFWTLHGDVGNYGMIQNLWKTEVYGLVNYLADKYGKTGRIATKDALMACSKAVPTDGLGITNSDLDQLGVPTYYDADQILFDYLNKGYGDESHPIIARYNGTFFKREDPLNIPREALLC